MKPITLKNSHLNVNTSLLGQMIKDVFNILEKIITQTRLISIHEFGDLRITFDTNVNLTIPIQRNRLMI